MRFIARLDTFAAVHKTGAQQAREHAKAYRELHESIRKIKDTATDVVQPGLAALGVTAFSIAGAIAAVTSAVKSFGQAGETLTFVNRQSGLTIGMIRALDDAGERFGVMQEAMNAGLEKFGAFMDQNARRAPDALNAWNQMPGAWARIGKSLVGLNRDAQINKVLDFIPSMKYIDQKRKLLAILGLPEDWANLTKEASIKIREAGREFDKMHPAAIENALKTKEAWDAMASSFKGIRDDMGAAFGPEAVKGFKAIHEFLDDKATIGVIGHEFQQIARSVRDTAAEIAEIIGYAKSFNEWWLGTNKKPEEKSEVVPPMNRWWNNLGVKDAITQGFLEALRQNSAGTYTPMAFHPGGGSSRGGGYFGSKDYPAVGGNAGANPMSGGGIVPDDAGAGTNAVVTGAGAGINRDKWAAQLRANPALRDKLYRRALGENSNPMANQAVMEEAANRADIRGNKSFDDHGNLKYFQGYYGGRISAKQREMLDSNFAKVFDQGSDISKGAIDNSSQWLSLKHERTGRFRTTANFGGDGITGHRGVESFQVPGTGESGAGEKSHYPEFRRRQLAEAAHRQMLAARE
jgi:hypothetical protein